MTDGWIEHDGKGMTVSAETMVLVKYRDGTDEGTAGLDPMRAGFWDGHKGNFQSNWLHLNTASDIVAYRVVKP